MFLNTLRCNHFLTKKKKKNKIMVFLILGWLGFLCVCVCVCVCVEVKAFTVVTLNILANNSKMYFIYFTNLFYNTPNIKCFIFLSLHLK